MACVGVQFRFMTTTDDVFELNAQIAADTCPVCSLPLCQVLLAKNAAWPWLILVPQRANLVEIIDLSLEDQKQLWREIDVVARRLKSIVTPDKLNIANLGNVVSQLHIHVVGRRAGDPAWPGPIWGSGISAEYDETEKEAFISKVRVELEHALSDVA